MSCEIQPARHNHQPTHQQGTKWASNGQKCQFWAKFGRFWAKNPFFTGEIKSSVTHITENPPRHLVQICLWSGIGQNVQRMPIFGPKWPKMHILDQTWPFWAKNPNLKGGSKSFGTHVTEKPPRHRVRNVCWLAMEPNGPKMPIYCQKTILGQIWPFMAKNPNFYGSK